ncbi:MAG: hypothetical protein HYR58_02845 [Acidobacteria bacterium]|nr:hypothetical protein [Acidobacteriota bacterium]
MFIQGSQSVGWDLRSINPVPTIAERVYALYAFLLLFVVVGWITELWRTLGFSSRTTRWRLKQALQHLRDGEVSALDSIAATFTKATPEAGLRIWADIPSESNRPIFLNVIKDGDEHFRIVAGRIELILGHMRRSLVFSGILLAAYFFFEASNIMRGISQEKASSFAALVAGGYQEISSHLGMGLVFIGAIYAIYWHFRARLARRRHDWENFCAHAKRLMH